MLPRLDGLRGFLPAVLAFLLAAFGPAARGEAAGPYIPAALAIPALASRAEAFVPDGFELEREVEGDFGAEGVGVAQVYRNAEGRRALLLGVRSARGFEATGWGFLVPCAACGVDLPADRNFEVEIRHRRVVITDRSFSKAEDTATSAELTLSYDRQAKRWWLRSLRQLTVFQRSGRAEESHVDYEARTTRDAVGRHDGQVFFAESVQSGRIEGEQPALDTLVLY